MRRNYFVPALLAALVLPGPVRAEDDGESPDAAVAYQMGKDLAELRSRVAELESALARLLEMDRQRVAVLEQVLRSHGAAPSPRAAPEPPKSSPRVAPSGPGTVAGRLTLPAGAAGGVVFIENIEGRMARGESLDITQKNRAFAPTWAVVKKGTRVTFPNQDTIYHNVFSTSGNAEFDLGIYRKGDEAKSYVFTRPGVAQVHCNMHSSMEANVLVVPNPHYAVVDANGRFRLTGVPSGKRKVMAWVPGYDPVVSWLELQPEQTAELQLAVTKRRSERHLNKHGQPYSSYE